MRFELVSGTDPMVAVDAALAALKLEHPLDDTLYQTLRLVLEEVLVNTFHHGYGDEAGRPVRVELVLKGDRLRIVVEDEAPPFNPFVEAPPPDLESDLEHREPGGLGIFLVQSLMDGVAYRWTGRGNRLELEKTITQSR